MKKYCVKCGRKNNENADYCIYCGGNIFTSKRNLPYPAADQISRRTELSLSAEDTAGQKGNDAPEKDRTGDITETPVARIEAGLIALNLSETDAEGAQEDRDVPETDTELPPSPEEPERSATAPSDHKKGILLRWKDHILLFLRKTGSFISSFFSRPGETPTRSTREKTAFLFVFLLVCVLLFSVILIPVSRKNKSPSPDSGTVTDEGYFENKYIGLYFSEEAMRELYPDMADKENNAKLTEQFQDDRPHVYSALTSCYYAALNKEENRIFVIFYDSFNGYKGLYKASQTNDYLEYVKKTMGMDMSYYDVLPITDSPIPLSGSVKENCVGEMCINRRSGYTQYFYIIPKSDTDIIVFYIAAPDQDSIEKTLELFNPEK